MGTWFFMFIDYISKCGNKLAVHGLNAACRRVLLIQQNVLSRELEWMFQNVEISCKIWISGFSWKSRGPGARPQHPKQPPPRAGGHSPDGSSPCGHRCFLLSSPHWGWVSVNTHLCNCKSYIIIQKYLVAAMSMANDRKQKNWNNWMFPAESVRII